MTANLHLTVVIPVYNEFKYLNACLQQVAAISAKWDWTHEIIVVDDGSHDGTVGLLRQWHTDSADARFVPVYHSENRGKGASIRTALSLAKGRWIIIQDADLEYNPNDIAILVRHAEQSGTDVVYGSRCLPKSGNPRRYNLFALGVMLLNVAVAVLYRRWLTDEATCYKLFRADDLRQMQLVCERFEFCPEVTAKACRLGLKIDELPIQYRPRKHSQGKKIKVIDGWIALKTLWRFRYWNPETPACCPASSRAGDR